MYENPYPIVAQTKEHAAFYLDRMKSPRRF